MNCIKIRLIEFLVVIGFFTGFQSFAGKLVDVTILPDKVNPERINKQVLRPSTFYIDFESGNDKNPGTKEKPWKHHPWDINARGNAAKTAGCHKYIFKKGVVYRGALVPDESGKEKNPIILTSENGWGKGRALLLASEKITGEWKKCAPQDYPEFFPEIADKIWQTDWDKNVEPRTMLELQDGKIIPIYTAREPDWAPWDESKGNDVKKDFAEVEHCYLELNVKIKDSSGFKVGDLVYGTGKWRDKDEDKVNVEKGSTAVTHVEPGSIKILIRELKKGEFKKGAFIGNVKVKQKILKISGTHDMISHIGDKKHFQKYKNFPASLWKGGVIWAEDYYGSIIYPSHIDSYDPESLEIKTNFHKNTSSAKKYSRYYLENIPFLLDECGEFYYNPKRKKLFVRLNGDRNPNNSDLETGKELYNIKIYNRSNISIENLSFSGCNEIPVTPEFRAMYWRGGLLNASILIRGNLKNISIKNCSFEHLPFGIISASMSTDKSDVMEDIEIANCRFESIGGAAIFLGSNNLLPAYLIEKGVKGRLRNVKVTGNYCHNSGFRTLAIWGFIHCIAVSNVELGEIAYNKTERTGGSGVIVFGPGMVKRFHQDVPVQRILLHHNYVKDSLLACQDYGGIAYWEGGPSYVYCNTSINPVGYKNVHHKEWHSKRKDWFRTSSFGVGIYADHGFKVYAFNNIILGTNNNCNDQFYSSCGWNEAAGFLNSFFNNTIYNFAIPMRKGMQEANRSKYLNNMALKVGLKFFRYDAHNIEFDTLAFANNVLQGKTKMFATVSRAWKDKQDCSSLSEWQDKLKQNLTLAEQTGWVVDSKQVVNAEKHNFEPLANSKAIDNAKKVFVPWGLYKVQGEWLFYKYKKDPSIIIDEHIYWNKDWFYPEKVRLTAPRNHLTAVNVDKASYVDGMLENWTKGALSLNGKDQFCKMSDVEKFNPGKGNFLIEAVIKTSSDGPLVSKIDESGKGYELSILPGGVISMALKWDNEKYLNAQCASIVSDGKWHHLLIELDRKNEKGITIYIDGKKLDCEFSGKMQALALENKAEFTVGKRNDRYLKCDLDFLRVARGNLKDAETNINELYKWQFDGPFLKDFFGNKPSGKARDVGAVERVNK